MRFKVGFAMGCAVGIWAASKASQLQRVGAGPKRNGPAANGSRTEAVTADKVRAISDLARARLGDLLESPISGVARDRMTELIGASLSGATASARWPR